MAKPSNPFNHSAVGPLNGRLAATLFAALLALPPASLAEDTEIFFGGATSGDDVIRPNVLFIMDTSGSMSSTVYGTGKSRMENMKEALHAILDSTSNVNVGLMRFHSRDNSDTDGGPILFPIANIDGDACDYETCAASGTAGSVLSQINASEDDAEQYTQNNEVSLDSRELELIHSPALATGEETIEGYVQQRRDDAEASPDTIYSTTDDDLDMGNYTVLFRFPGLDIPADATVSAAEIELTAYQNYSGAAPTTNIRVELPADGDADLFGDGENASSRNWWGTSVLWDPIPILPEWTRFSTPDLSAQVEEALKSSNNWSAGNAMAFHFSDNNNGYREVASYRVSEPDYRDDPTVRPKLTVTYSTGAGLADARQTVGLRFRDVGVPQGARVTGAWLEFTAAQSHTGSYSLTVHGEASDDAPAFTDTVNDIGARSRTGASVAWGNVEAWSSGNSYQSPDLTTIVQEIVNRPNWCGGNAMAFMVSGIDALNRRIAHAYDGAPELAPILRVTYDEPVGGYASGQGCVKQTLVSQIATGNDDAEENVSSGYVTRGSSDLELVYDGSTRQIVGLRFTALPIPQGASILWSYLDFEVDEQKTGAMSLAISAHDIDDAPAIGSSTGDLSNRTRTSASVTWSNPPEPAVNATLTSPDIASVIREVTQRGGWASGNDIVILIEQGSGSNMRTVESFNGEAAAAPKLRVRYQWNLGDQTGPQRTVRQALKSQVDDFVATGYTPIVETLYEAGRYYRGEELYFGRTRGFGGNPPADLSPTGYTAEKTRLSHPASYTGGTIMRPSGCTADNPGSTLCRKEYIDGTPIYNSPIQNSCQANYVVLLSDGLPNSMDSTSETAIEATLGAACTGSGGAKCGNDLARFLFTQDQRDDIQDAQTVKTFTIGFAISGATFLEEMADEGGGEFYEAQDATQLTAVFQSILAEILEQNTTYTAPAVSVNAFNRLTHREELYFALFRPSGDAKWVGNVKRYKLGGHGGDRSIVDVNGAEAVDPSTGFFKNGVTSWWTHDADAPDGDDVALGGAAQQLTNNRSVYTYAGASAPSDESLTSHPLHENNAAITKTLLDITDQTDLYRENLLMWARGIDVLDVDNDGSTTDARQQLGDPLHSKPVLVTYGGTEAVPDITLYATTNEGYLHAINTATGAELFSFVPKELLGNLDRFYVNAGGDHPYGLDGPLALWYHDANHNGALITSGGAVEAGEHAYLYMGMRRGGRNYYALDVTDRGGPTLKWMIQGGAGDFAELGQSWSYPNLTKIKLNGVEKMVLIFGGGYDTNQDSNLLPENDSVGRAVYIVDAETGQRLWWAGPSGSGADLVLPGLTNSIPADVRPVDLDADGYADRIYFVDTRARIWRVDLDIKDNGGASDLASGGIYATLGGTTAADNRRFYYGVDVAYIVDGDYPFLSLSVGSGYRSHPLDQTIHDRFYMVRDEQIGAGPKVWAGYTPITEADLYDATNDVIGGGSAADRAAAITALDNADGWYIRVDTDGEKVISESITFADYLIFTSFKPTREVSDSCLADVGTATAYVVSVVDASAQFDFDESQPGLERSHRLTRGGLPPEPVILLPPPQGEPPVVLVGPEQLPIDLTNPLTTRFWQEVQ